MYVCIIKYIVFVLLYTQQDLISLVLLIFYKILTLIDKKSNNDNH